MERVRIAIIDDESLVRLGIKSSVEWEKHGYEIVGEADNGQSGWTLIEKQKPDIILLDICMPVMDGLEVLKKVRETGLDCKVIVLSCHDDFHFVKEAMKNGAFDYLRKNEINSANILGTLEEIRDTILKENKNFGHNQRVSNKGSDAYAHRAYLQSLVMGEEDYAGHTGMGKRLHLSAQWFYCAVFSIRGYRQVLARYEGGNLFQFENNVINLCMAALEQHTCEAEIFLLKENLYVLLMSDRNCISEAAHSKTVKSLLNDLQMVLKDFLNVETCFGYSDIFAGFSNIHAAFKKAYYSHELRFFQPEKAILCETQEPEKTLEEEEAKQYQNTVYKALSVWQYQKAFEVLFQFMDWMKTRERKNIDVFGIRNYFSDIVRLMMLQEQKSSNDAIKTLQMCETLEETKVFFEQLQKEEFGQNAVDTDQKHYLIRAATKYIQENLCRDITLDEIADHLFISKSYLCRLFQKNLGLSVQKYIHSVRVEKAKEYLNDYRWKIYEIAEMTGFNSCTHFNIVFKKIMHCTPIEYRNGFKTTKEPQNLSLNQNNYTICQRR